MKLIFAGTPPFAAAALHALARAGHEVVLVLTQPDRPAGRGLKLTPSAVAVAATELGFAIAKPPSLKNPTIQDTLRSLNADVMIVAAYGLLLPQAVLDMPRFGCLNIHGSLLPRWRGAAPIQRAIEAGDVETGIAIMQMDAGLDTGAVLLERRLPITADDTSATLFVKLAELGAEALCQALARYPAITPQPQASAGATYATKIDKSEARINWCLSAIALERRCRAFDPFPGCETLAAGETLKIWRASVLAGNAAVAPGTILSVEGQTMSVQCGSGALGLQIVQRPGGKRLAIGDFMRSTRLQTGEVLG